MRITAPVAVCLLLLPLLPACTPAQMRMPDGFAADAVAYGVSGHSPRRFNQPVRFGPYSALRMREGSTFSWRVPLPAFDVGRTSRPYDYTMVARDQPPVEVQCRTQAWTVGRGDASGRLTVDVTALAGPLLACGLRMDGRPPQALEVMHEGDGLRGHLRSPWGSDYTVRAVYGYQGTPVSGMTPTGYAIADGGSALAVVDVVNGGRVHLDRRLDDEQRVYVAAAAAALLLLDPEPGE
ncbi:MAG: hypothetical protein ABS96_20700 [Lysobacteraceae bacterium SCN 69-123]|uniref:hypothetical protein n=1 Tax=Stenotrophomonas acidaminiphila TaxID=128780 RepID=UPI000869E58B|nr:hypothetical protein [Stenotrophomonas acidaminiphila]MBN8800537.1 hypothetical protein [Stenotrophomonas acidaminiphila]MDF9440930.1 hypothetical protein [Stenotrophomonas acidaminiphila]ODU43928.1 MAG: hypothetical protein ABS96_20700 [Xanthomonadaceae bacterium SCN 69-123]